MRRRYHHFSIRSILSFFLGVGVVGVLKSGACMNDEAFSQKRCTKNSFPHNTKVLLITSS